MKRDLLWVVGILVTAAVLGMCTAAFEPAPPFVVDKIYHLY